MAHLAIYLAARLHIYHTRRQSGFEMAYEPQLDDNDGIGRSLARGELAIRYLGGPTWQPIGWASDTAGAVRATYLFGFVSKRHYWNLRASILNFLARFPGLGTVSFSKPGNSFARLLPTILCVGWRICYSPSRFIRCHCGVHGNCPCAGRKRFVEEVLATPAPRSPRDRLFDDCHFCSHFGPRVRSSVYLLSVLRDSLWELQAVKNLNARSAL